MPPSRLPAAAAALVLSAAAGCNTVDELFDPSPPIKAGYPTAVVPQRFLHTTYEPLNAWLDEPIRAQIIDVPLAQFFMTPELRGTNFVVGPLPAAELVNVDGFGISRRQLLWAVAHEHKLRMTPRYFGPDRPAFIEVDATEPSRLEFGREY